MAKLTKCDTHNTCKSSDSNLPTCSCWCAECKENRSELAKLNKGLIFFYGKAAK